MSETTHVLYELEQRPDGSVGIGNSIEVETAEAIALVQAGKAKFEGCAIGVVPDGLVMKDKRKGVEAD